MQAKKTQDTVVFKTNWFDLVARKSDDSPHPYYVMNSPDFAAVIAFDDAGNLLLVRQYRHGVQAETLELPSGHVEAGETPEQAARKELLEETGYVADHFELLAELSPSTGRFSNRIWCYLARNARPEPCVAIESGMELVIYRKGLRALVEEKEFCNAVQYGALAVALLSGKISA
ncbi:MAG TPA: NUDIX hydrolase [Candidatus Paceibacterota bacterium]|nr:NUDIX hydrolase [Candidatus Paceibacterota bacterium]